MQDAELKKIFNGKKPTKTVKKNGDVTNSQGFSSALSFEDFKQWFSTSEFEKGCHYCGTTNAQSEALYYQRPHATRGGKRGKRLELDRKEPLLPYDNLDNLVWCCYWCNNAKSNFFTAAEFKPIAEAIGKVIQSIK